MKLLCIVTLVHSSAIISVLFTFIGWHSSRSFVLFLSVVFHISQFTDDVLLMVAFVVAAEDVIIVAVMSVTVTVELVVAEVVIDVTVISVELTLVSVDVLAIITDVDVLS